MKCLAVACMVAVLASGLIAQESPIVEKLESANAWINWERQVIKAVGVGVLPGDVEDQKESERLAREAAGVNAYRNMETAIRLVRINGETYVNDHLIADKLLLPIRRLAHSAEIVSDRQRYDRSFEVILQLPLARIAAIFPKSDGSDRSDRSDRKVVLDARGLALLPALQPRVFDKAGNEVYSGIAGYSTDVSAGDIIKAVEVRNLTDVVIGGKAQADEVTILLSPARESGKRTPAPSPSRGSPDRGS